MAQVRTWQDVEALEPTGAERRLIAACKAGHACMLGILSPPEAGDPSRTIRAELLRYLILGGCEKCRVAETGVQLVGAWVSGRLNLNWATAQAPVRLSGCCFAEEITALQASLPRLALDGSALPGLNAQGVQVAGDVSLNNGFQASGTVSLSGARIGGQLSCSAGKFDNPNNIALNAQSAQVTGGVFFRNGFSSKGTVSLAGAKIGGQLGCEGGWFENEKGIALNAQGAQVTDAVFLSDGFQASGDVSLSGARVGGQLSCIGARFENAGGTALNAEGVQVMGDVLLHNGFRANGTINLAGAWIGGQLSCAGAQIQNPEGDALNCQQIQVSGSVLLLNNFKATGEVRFLGAKIAQIACDGARLSKSGGNAFNGQSMRIEGSFIWRSVTVDEGTVFLAAAHVGDLVDDPESWPGGGRVYLDGFTYDRIAASFTDARRRLKWLAKGDRWKGEFFPQPYTHLARVLRAMGHDRAARAVLVERERLLRAQARRAARIVPDGSVRAGLLSIWRDLTNIVRGGWDITTRWTIGYGHRPVQSIYALLVLFAVATVLADRAWQAGDFAPASDVILSSPGWQALADSAANPAQAWSAAHGPGRDWESFNRYAFAADVVIPLIDFGQTQAWAPSTTRGPWGWHLWWARWVLSGLGWVVTALGAAAVTGITGRARE